MNRLNHVQTKNSKLFNDVLRVVEEELKNPKLVSVEATIDLEKNPKVNGFSVEAQIAFIENHNKGFILNRSFEAGDRAIILNLEY